MYQLVQRDVLRVYSVVQLGGVLTGGGVGSVMRAGAGIEFRLGSTLVLGSELTGGWLAGKAGMVAFSVQLAARW